MFGPIQIDETLDRNCINKLSYCQECDFMPLLNAKSNVPTLIRHNYENFSLKSVC